MTNVEKKMKELELAAASLGLEKVYRALPLRMLTELNKMNFDFENRDEDYIRLKWYLMGFKDGVNRGLDETPTGTM